LEFANGNLLHPEAELLDDLSTFCSIFATLSTSTPALSLRPSGPLNKALAQIVDQDFILAQESGKLREKLRMKSRDKCKYPSKAQYLSFLAKIVKNV